MKTRSILPLYRSALAGAAILLLIAAPGRAHAGFLLAISQTGGNVVVNGSGTINTTALTLVSNPGQVGPQINSPYAVLVAGSQASTTQYGGLTGPANFGGSGGSNNVSAGSATGTLVGILGAASYLDLSQNYVSGSTISDSATFTNATFASLGFTPGTYTYTWGTGANADSLTVTSAPEPSTWALLGLGAAALGLTLRGQRRRTARA